MKFPLRSITVMAMLLAFYVVLRLFGTIYITPQFRIGFTFIPIAVTAFLYGPWAALIFGFLSDILGYISRPTGPYFPGFAISEMVHGLIYAFFLYKRPVDSLIWLIIRVAIARVLIAVVVLFGLNYIWFSFFGHLIGAPANLREPFVFFIATGRLLSNLLLLPTYIFFSVVFVRLADKLHKRIY